MVSGLLLSVLAIGYLLVLFAVAFYGERRSVYPGHARLRPWIYSLALGVYCTTWTFFGAVGTAVRDGWAYVPIYLGPALVFLFAAPFLERLVAVVRAHNITSIADLISSRFGKSPALAALVATIALTAAIPYLALQYKAVGTSIDVLTGASGVHPAWYADTALWVALLMALFAILFGTRRLDATEHHEGVMLAIAFESLVKLLAFLAVGIFAMLHLDGAPALSATRLGSVAGVFSGDFAVTTVLAAAAIFCLPRQFLVAAVECADTQDVRRARVVFTAYIAVFTLVVVPVVLAGLGAGLGAAGHNPDSFVLTLPLEKGAAGIAVLAFLGGLSAATAMVIVASIALATMITNDLVMPLLWRSRWLRTTEGGAIGALVLWLRRTAIMLLALLAYAYHRNTAAPTSLASIGLLAFAAVAQFAPPILAGLYWRRATRAAVFWGLVTGFVVWTYTLLLPNFAAGGLIGPGVLDRDGPWEPLWLGAQQWLGLANLSPVTRGALLALGANVTVLVVLSLLARTSLRERMAATAFVRPALPGSRLGVTGGARVGDVLAIAERIVGGEAAAQALRDYSTQMLRAPPKQSEPADRGLMQHMERVLAGAIGASSARLMFTHALRGRGLAAEEVAEMLDETSQELRFSRQLLQATMENVSQGISVADSEGRIVAWNRRYLDLFDYPADMVRVGRPVADLIRWNAEHGEFGETDPEVQVRKRLAHMQAGTAYVIQRTRRNGRVFEIRGQAMPDGGYVTTYTDITEFKRTERELLEAKQTLEQRVAERTQALSQALVAEAAAKQSAELANATKTRFVAAASHDLLQPLNAARLFASALHDSSQDTAVREIAGRIEGSMRAAEEVLDDMLDIARLESGAMRANPASVRPGRAARGTGATVQPRCCETRPAAARAPDACLGALRPRARAQVAAEPDVERAALHATGRRAGGEPAARRAGRGAGLGHGPRHRGAAPQGHLQRVSRPGSRLAVGRKGPRPRPVDLRSHCPVARPAARAQVARRTGFGVQRAPAGRRGTTRHDAGRHRCRPCTRLALEPGRRNGALRGQRRGDPARHGRVARALGRARDHRAHGRGSAPALRAACSGRRARGLPPRRRGLRRARAAAVVARRRRRAGHGRARDR